MIQILRALPCLCVNGIYVYSAIFHMSKAEPFYHTYRYTGKKMDGNATKEQRKKSNTRKIRFSSTSDTALGLFEGWCPFICPWLY
jgi:hypothetical protein